MSVNSTFSKMTTMKLNLHAKLVEYFESFLNHKTRKLLVIEMDGFKSLISGGFFGYVTDVDLLVNISSVQQILTKLEENLKLRYGGQDDSMFLSWRESSEDLTAVLKDLEVVPKFPNLVVFEFDKKKMYEQDISVLKKIVDYLSVGPSWKKAVLVASNKEQVNNALKIIQNEKFCFLEEALQLTRICKNLFEAASKGFLDEVVTFIENDADINQADDDKNTPLHMAARNCHRDIVLKLLQKGAEHLRNKDGDTPLHLAAKFGHSDVVMTLIENGVDINIWGKSKNSPLHYASESGHKDVVIKLLRNGSKQYFNTFHYTPLHSAAEYEHHDVVVTLLKYGANVNVGASGRETPLHVAAQSRHEEIVRTLILYGADIHARRGHSSETALHFAASYATKSVVNTLVEYGAKVDAADAYGDTPLHSAVENGNLETVKFLIEMLGANLNAKNESNQTPLNLARSEGQDAIIEYLQSKGAE